LTTCVKILEVGGKGAIMGDLCRHGQWLLVGRSCLVSNHWSPCGLATSGCWVGAVGSSWVTTDIACHLWPQLGCVFFNFKL
jgi:hypothetical protein